MHIYYGLLQIHYADIVVREAAMDNSPLSKLPSEIRNYISELVLIPEDWHWMRSLPYSHRIAPRYPDLRKKAKLTATCKQLRDETRAMFWSHVTLFIDCRHRNVHDQIASMSKMSKVFDELSSHYEYLIRNMKSLALPPLGRIVLELPQYAWFRSVQSNSEIINALQVMSTRVDTSTAREHELELAVKNRDFVIEKFTIRTSSVLSSLEDGVAQLQEYANKFEPWTSDYGRNLFQECANHLQEWIESIEARKTGAGSTEGERSGPVEAESAELEGKKTEAQV